MNDTAICSRVAPISNFNVFFDVFFSFNTRACAEKVVGTFISKYVFFFFHPNEFFFLGFIELPVDKHVCDTRRYYCDETNFFYGSCT